MVTESLPIRTSRTSSRTMRWRSVTDSVCAAARMRSRKAWTVVASASRDSRSSFEAVKASSSIRIARSRVCSGALRSRSSSSGTSPSW